MLALLGMVAATIEAAADTRHESERASVQAQATVRIVHAARIRFGRNESTDVPAARPATIRIDGLRRAAKLVEFE